MNKVTIVGAGLAGMTAALRLLQNDFQVELLDQDSFMGGMLRACKSPDRLRVREFESPDDPDDPCPLRHEHSYHMLMNWYVNTWDIINELGVRDNFSPSQAFSFLYSDPGIGEKRMYNVGSPDYLLRNVKSGLQPLPDMFIFMYSLIDLLTKRFHRTNFLDRISVNGFLASRPYATSRAAELHQKVWETVWAIPSYNASAYSYKEFLKFGNYAPKPQLWLFNKNKYDALIRPWEEALHKYDFKFLPWKYVHDMKLDENGRVKSLWVSDLSYSPSIEEPTRKARWQPRPVPRELGKEMAIEGDLIIATTPGAMTRMLDASIFKRGPHLADLRKVNAVPMVVVELHFKEGVWLQVPEYVTVLVDAKYQMTFLDYSKHWPGLKSTLLYVTCSDCAPLMCLEPEKREKPVNVTDNRPGKLVLNLDQPSTAIEYLLVELRKTVPFSVDQVDLERTLINTNDGADLFANDTGSWDWRPDTVTNIPNLFLAGTYVRNYANVATIEGAVTSGLMAADAVCRSHGVKPNFEIKQSGCYPEPVFDFLKWAWAPYAYGAKLWSMASDAYGVDPDIWVRPWLYWIGKYLETTDAVRNFASTRTRGSS